MMTPSHERAAWVALIPICLTGLFYLLSSSAQRNPLLQLFPQLAGYGAMAVWWTFNANALTGLGLSRSRMDRGLLWGVVTGCVLGALNTTVILWAVPALGGDITFLIETPHAKVPALAMIPWLIVVIAAGVELNFRGFLLGRLESVCCRWLPESFAARPCCSLIAMLISALVFAFDPFMVMTFRHLHWIAVWDGLIWAAIFLRWRNLLAVIAAHAVEVMIMYLGVNSALT